MKTTELKKLIKEAVKEAIQEEIKDILLEAVRAPKGVSVGQSFEQPLTETKTVSKPKNIAEQRSAYASIMGDMRMNGGNMNLSSNDVNTFRPTAGNTTAEGSALPSGNVGLDMIMGLMKGK